MKKLLLFGICAVLISCSSKPKSKKYNEQAVEMNKKFNEQTALEDIQAIIKDSSYIISIGESCERIIGEGIRIEDLTYGEIIEYDKKWRPFLQKLWDDKGQEIQKSVSVNCIKKYSWTEESGWKGYPPREFIYYELVAQNNTDDLIKIHDSKLSFISLNGDTIKSFIQYWAGSHIIDCEINKKGDHFISIEAGDKVNLSIAKDLQEGDNTFMNIDLSDLKFTCIHGRCSFPVKPGESYIFKTFEPLKSI